MEFYSNCVSWPDDVEILNFLIDGSRGFSVSAFLEAIGQPSEAQLKEALGYMEGSLPSLETDYHVQAYKHDETGIVFLVHSAIEWVYASADQIQELKTSWGNCLSLEEEGVLVLVHPGSLFGSAEHQVGKFEARAARDEIFQQIQSHHGGFIVIDGALSDEIPAEEHAIISSALVAAAARGHPALRLWGCDSGESPYSKWVDFGSLEDGLVHSSQEEAIVAASSAIGTAPVAVTGAWASCDGSTGCVNSVVDALKAHCVDAIQVRVDDTALFDPEAADECDQVSP